MKKKKILVVDDESDLTMLLEYIIRSTGLYDVVIANNGLEAEEKAVKEKPDLVFLDFIMPEIRGDEVLKFLRSQPGLEDIPVVIMSGLGGNVYFDDQQEKQEVIQVDLKIDSDNMLGRPSSIAFPKELMKKYKVAGTLPKPFTSKSLKDLIARIFREHNN